jgi:hypothetical protein
MAAGELEDGIWLSTAVSWASLGELLAPTWPPFSSALNEDSWTDVAPAVALAGMEDVSSPTSCSCQL